MICKLVVSFLLIIIISIFYLNFIVNRNTKFLTKELAIPIWNEGTRKWEYDYAPVWIFYLLDFGRICMINCQHFESRKCGS